MWAKLTEKNSRKRTKLITDLRELSRFLSPPGIEVAKYVSQTGDGVLFAQYIDTYLKLKPEGSVYPD
jgi:hypothetical protein